MLAFPGTRAIGGCKLSSVGSLKEKEVILTTELAIWPQ